MIAACNGKVVMGSSLSDALTQLIGQQLAQTTQELQTPQQQQGTQELQNFSQQLSKLKGIFEDAKKALQEGNWEEFGRKFKELDEMMKNIK